jgi:tRNA A-37 threonylcarbamoyl transferase component Bud32
MDVYLARKRIRLDPAQALGKGGEADVFRLGDGRALKVFKPPEHPDYQGFPVEQRAAEERIREHQQKLRAFPAGLPARVVAPEELATDRSGRRIVGYAMRLVAGAEPLVRYADPAFRRSGISSDAVTAVFRDIHATVAGLHGAGVIVGDFNDLNVLVTTAGAFFIDADSFQFGGYRCAVFTDRFVDPLLCDPHAAALRLVYPYGPGSDWYSFATLLMQSLLFVGPFGGIYRPHDPKFRVAHAARPLRRITVFHPEVIYPKPAVSFRVLPDDLLHHFHAVFERDERVPFPLALLESLRFTRCPRCGIEHARAACPLCSPLAAARASVTVQVRGTVRCTPAFESEGAIVHAASHAGVLRLVHHDGSAYRREDGAPILAGPLDPALRFRALGVSTVVGRGSELAVLSPGRPTQRLAVDANSAGPAFDANGHHLYWTAAGRLLRDAPSTWGGDTEAIGDVLESQTRIWVGPAFGLGLYRAANLCVAFVFDAEKSGVNDGLRVPALRGQLVDADCVLDEERAWLVLALRAGGKTSHLCLAYSREGVLMGLAEAEAWDGSWLGSVRGKCAVHGVLLAPTDAGIVRVEPDGGRLRATREFPDTEPFVDSGTQLLAGKEGLWVVQRQSVAVLRMN